MSTDRTTMLPHLHAMLGSSATFRRGLFVFFIATAGFLWWFLASPRTTGEIFGRYSFTRFSVLLLVTYVLAWCTYFSLSRESFAGKAANFTLTTFTLLLLLGLLELPAAFGAVDYRKFISPPDSFLLTRLKPWDNAANLLDKELMHIHRPYQKFVGETQGDLVNWLGIPSDKKYQVNIQYDSRGFRNDHEIAQSPVVAIGDSFPEAILVQKEDVLSSRLNKLLQMEVANLGQGGYGPQQELVTLRRYGLPLQPRVILWLFFEGNDLLDVPRYERFIRDWEMIEKKRNSFGERSFTKNALLTLAGFTAPQSRSDGVEARRRSGKFLESGGTSAETLYFAYPGTALSDEEVTSLETAKNCFLEAQKLGAGGGAKLVFIYIPTKFRVYGEFCEFPNDGYGKDWRPNDLPSHLEKWSKAHEIPFLDLTSALKESARNGELTYFTDDGHWNARGHQVAAQTIAHFLESGGWLAAAKTPDTGNK